MSQRRQKKQLNTMDNIESLTDHELREALKGYDQAPGPITESTRNLYRRKLATLIDQGNGVEDDDDDDTSDEDYIDQEEEESEDEDLEDEEESDEEDEEEELFDELGEDSVKQPDLSTESDNQTTSMVVGSDATPNRISRGILIAVIVFFVSLFLYYLVGLGSLNSIITGPLKQYKSVTRELVSFLSLLLIGYFVYRTINFYRKRSHEEMQRVCSLVDDVMELLQSPDNPKGLMPVLHIRDTLLTPPERKTKKMIKIWNKAVDFIEEHESRVKVELINIDGEDFRAWKWIGSRKL